MSSSSSSSSYGNQSDECSATSREWASFILTIITMNVTWWLLDIPLLIKFGFRPYLRAVRWQCFRAYMPAVAALVALGIGRNPLEHAYIFYTGPFSAEMNYDIGMVATPGLSKLKLLKSVITDLTTVTATIVSLSITIEPSATEVTGKFPPWSWVFPSLPVAVIGLWLLLNLAVGIRTRWVIVSGALFLVLVGVAACLPLALLSPVAKAGKWWILSVVGYAYMALPVAAMRHGVIIMACTFLALMFRTLSMGLASLSENPAIPLCGFGTKTFGIIYITVGAIGALLAFLGCVHFPSKSPWVAQKQGQNSRVNMPS